MRHKGFVNGEIKEKANRQGFTNGCKDSFTNGCREDSFVNGTGKGRTNGMGGSFTNGVGGGMTNGMTNGLTNGMTNGTINPPIPTNSNPFKKRRSSGWISIIIVAIFLTSGIYMVMSQSHEFPPQLAVDGGFREWEGVERYDLGFADLMLNNTGSDLHMAIEKPNLLKGNGNITESFYFMFNDKTRDNGFLLGHDTYEYYIDLYGADNTVSEARGYQFNGDANGTNWAGFTNRYTSYPLPRANNDSFLEFKVSSVMFGKTNITEMEILVYHYDTEGSYKYSQVIDVDVKGKYENVRSPVFTYSHDFETSTLEIKTRTSLAYSSIPYKIRVLRQQVSTVEVSETSTSRDPFNKDNASTIPRNENQRGTTLTIEYEFTQSDVITQCGGFILSTTHENMEFDDTGFILYGINKTVTNMVLSGDIEYEVVKEGTRGGMFNLKYGSPGIGEEICDVSDSEVMYVPIHTSVTTDPSINGKKGDAIWDGEQETYAVDLTKDMTIEAIIDNDVEALYMYVRMEDDSTQDSSAGAFDFIDICFDTDHDGGSAPQTDDKAFEYQHYMETDSYFEGTGSGWGSQTMPTGWEGHGALTGSPNRICYEFRFDLDEFGTDWDEDGDIMGICVMAYDHDSGTSPYYLFGYPEVYDPSPLGTDYRNDPDEWKDIRYTDSEDWEVDCYKYMQELTFDNSGQTDDLENFPVMVKLTSSNFNYSAVQSDGDDIRFYDCCLQTELDYYCEEWNNGGDSYFWVNVPHIEGGSSDDRIWIVYSNPEASNGEDEGGVFSNDFVGVWNMDDDGATQYDSREFCNITKFGNTNVTGVVGNGTDFDGIDDWLNTTEYDQYFNVTDEDAFTISFWAKTRGSYTQWQPAINMGYDSWGEISFYHNIDDGWIIFNKENASENDNILGWYGADAYVIGEWFYCVGRFNGTHSTIMMRNQTSSGFTWKNASYPEGLNYDEDAFLWFGTSTGGGGGQHWNGSMDNVYFSNASRSLDWLVAEFLTANNSFITFGDEIRFGGLVGWTMDSTITIDGVLDEGAWSSIADVWVTATPYVLTIYTMRDENFTYIGIISNNDTGLDNRDRLNIYFDTNYNRSNSPSTDDRRYLCGGTNSTTYYEGTGSTWSSTTLPSGWDAKAWKTSGECSFEFKVNNTHLNTHGKYNEDCEEIGFGVYGIVYIQAQEYHHIWFPCEYEPSTKSTVTFQFMDNTTYWGLLFYEVPEGELLVMTLPLLAIAVVMIRKKRRGAE